MSQTIDEKVVKMEFDNSDFESNVKTSLSTLDKLKSSLDLSESAKSFDSISKAANKVSLDGMGNAIDTVKTKFSVLEAAASVALGNIATQAVDASIKFAKANSIDLVTAGWGQYEEKTKAVQTIMNATGLSIDEVNSQLSKLIWFTDETSYSFVDMTSTIGKFTSMGVGLDDSVTAMEGISNWAAVSGVGINEASRAMYNLSQAMGVGAVKLMDWKSIQNANMATKEFKEQVISVAKELGVLTESGQTAKGTMVDLSNFDQTLSEGWFNSDVLLKVLKNYAEYTDLVYERVQETGESAADAMKYISDIGEGYSEIGDKALRAAQEAKTLGDAMDAVKDAVKSQWGALWENVFGNYEEGKVTWTNLANTLYDIFADPIGSINEEFEEALSTPSITMEDWAKISKELSSDLGLSGTAVQEFERVVRESAKKQGVDVDSLEEKWGSFYGVIENGYITSDIIQDALKTIDEGLVTTGDNFEDFKQVVEDVMSGKYGNVDTGRFEKLYEAGYDALEIQSVIDDMITNHMTLEEAMAANNIVLAESSAEVSEELKKIIHNGEIGTKTLDELYNEISGAELRNMALDNVINALGGYAGAVRDAFESVFGTLESGTIKDALRSIYEWSEKIFDEKKIAKFQERLTRLLSGINSILNVVKGVWEVVKAFLGSSIVPVISGIVTIIMAFADGVGKLFVKLNDATGKMTVFADAADWVTQKLAPFKKAVEVISKAIADFITALFDGRNVFDAFERSVDDVIKALVGGVEGEKAIAKFNNAFNIFRQSAEKLWDTLKSTAKIIKEFFGDLFSALKDTEIGKSITAFFDKIKQTFIDVKNSVGNWFKDLFDFGPINPDLNFLDVISNALTDYGEKISEIDVKELANNISDGLVGFKNKIKSVWSNVKGFFTDNEAFTDGLDTAVTTVKSKFSELKEAITIQTDNTDGNFLDKALVAIKTALQWLVENAPSVDEVITTIEAILGGATLASLISLIKKIKNLFGGDGLTGLLKNINGVLSGLSLALKGWAFDEISSGVLKLAGAFGIFAVTLAALTYVDQDNLQNVAIVIGTLAAGIGTLAIGFSALYKALNGNKTTKAITGVYESIAGMFTSFGGAATTVAGGASTFMTTLSSGLVLPLQTLSEGISNFLKTSARSSAILKYAVALGVLTASVYALSLINTEDLLRSVGALTVMMMELAGISNFMKGVKFSSGAALVLMSTSIIALIGSLALLTLFDIPALTKGIVAIGAIMAEMTGFLRFSGDLKLSTAVNMLAIASVLTTFVASVAILARYDFGQILKAVIGLGSVLLEIGLFANKSKDMSKLKIVGLLSTSVSLLLIADAISKLTSYNFGQILSSAIGFGLVLLEIGLFATYSKDMRKLQVVGLLAASASLLLVAEGISKICKFDFGQLLSVVVTFGMVIAEILVALKIFEKLDVKLENLAALVAVGLALMEFGKAISYLIGIPFGELIAAVGSIALLLGTLVGASALISRINADLVGISMLMISAAALITAVAAAIWLVTDAVKNMKISEVKNVLAELIVGLIEDLIAAIVGSADAIIQGIIDLLSSIADNAGQIINVVVDLIVNILDALSEKMPVFAESISTFCQSLMDSFAVAFEGVDITPILIALGSIFGTVIALTGLGKIGSFTSLTKGLLMVAEVIGAFGVVVAAFGALNLIPGFAEFMNGGVEILGIIGSAIGSFIGNIGGGLAEGFTSHLPQIGTDLSEFMDNVSGFLTGMPNIDSTFVDSCTNLVAVMSAMVAGNLFDNIATGFGKLFGGQSVEDYMGKFVTLGESLSAFCLSIKDIDTTGVEGARNAAAIIVSLMNAFPSEITGIPIIDWITGAKNLATAPEKFSYLGQGINSFLSSLGNVTASNDSITAASNAAAIITTLMDIIPNEGGLWQKIAGESSWDKAGTNFGSMGKGVANFINALNGVTADSSTITTSANAAEIINTLMAVIPNEGGLWQKIVGESGWGSAGTNFKSLGEGVSNFINSLNGTTVDDAALASAEKAASIISALMCDVPNEGGLWAYVAGQKNFASSKENFTALGEGVAGFINALKTVGNGEGINVDLASSATEVINELMSVVPNEGGLWQSITGTKDLGKVETNFTNLGKGVAGFLKALEGVTGGDSATVAADAAAAIQAISDVTPNTGGIWQDITGTKDFSQMASNMVALGIGIKSFINSTKDVSTSDAMQSYLAAKTMSMLFDLDWPTDGGLWNIISGAVAGTVDFDKIGENLVKMGNAISDFDDASENINISNINSAKTAAVSVIALLNLEWPQDDLWTKWFGTDSESKWLDIATNIGAMGGVLLAFSNATTGINANSIVVAGICAKIITTLVTGIPTDEASYSSMGTLGDKLKELASSIVEFQTTMSTITAASITSSCNSINELIAVIKTMAGVDFTRSTMFSKSLADLATSSIKDFCNAFRDSEKTAIQYATNFINNISKALTAPNEFQRVASENIRYFNNGITANTNNVVANITSLINTAINSLYKYTEFYNAGIYNINGLTTGITNSGNSVYNAAAGAASKGTDGIKICYNSFYNAGAYMMDGLCSGMNAWSTSVYNTAYNLGVKALQAAKKAVDSNSPSKKFIELGKFNAIGLAQGMEQYSSIVEDSAYNVSETALDTVKATLNQINFDDLDNAPVIRPVLDLSDIQNGANGINDILATESGIRLNALNASIMAKDINAKNEIEASAKPYDDSGVIATIERLGARVDNLGASISNMKFMLNGRNVASIIANDMDNELGAMYTRVTRGGY